MTQLAGFTLGSLMFVLGTSLPARAVTIYEPPPAKWASGSYGATLTAEYFTTKANYDAVRGSYKRLLGDSSFTTLDGRLKARYGFTSRFMVFAGLGFAQTRAVDLLQEKAATGLNDAFVGMNVLAWRKGIRLIPELQLGYPVNEPTDTQTIPLLSDGAMYGRVGMHILKPYRRFRMQGYVGSYIPMQGLANRFLYEVGAEMRLFSAFSLGGSFGGYEAFGSDSNTELFRNLAATRMNAGSKRYAAFEPALMEARGWIGFMPDDSLMLRLGFSKTLDGLRTAEGQSFLFTVAFNDRRAVKETSSEITYQERASDRAQDRISEEDALRKFEAEADNTDQELFQLETGAPQQKPARKSNLDDTERLLEKRSRDNRK